MKKIHIIIFIFIANFIAFSFIPSVYAAGTDIYQFKSNTQQLRFQKLSSDLRCLVCQNQNLAESNAPLAADLRKQIAQHIVAGYSDEYIIAYLVNRYGNFILYKPPFIETTAALWLAPFLLLVIGFVILYVRIRYFRRVEPEAALTQEQEARLNSLLSTKE